MNGDPKKWIAESVAACLRDADPPYYTIGCDMFNDILKEVRNEALREAASICRTSANQYHAAGRIKAIIVQSNG